MISEKNMNKSIKKTMSGDKISKYFLLLVFIALVAFFSVAADSFFRVNNFMNISKQSAVIGILAVAMTFVIISGGIDLSVGSVVGLSGVVLGSMAQFDNENWWVGIGAALAVATILGLINGIFIAKFNIVPFIQTLAMMTIARGLTMIYSDGKPISNLNQNLTKMGSSSFGIPISAWVFLLMLIIAYFILKHTVFGSNIYALGGNEKASLISGINTSSVKILVYTISGFLSGVAAIVLTSRVASALPRAGEGYEMDAIAAVVIGGASLTGGRGTISGTLIGTLLIGVLSNGMDLMSIDSYHQSVIKGIIIILAVLLDSLKNKE